MTAPFGLGSPANTTQDAKDDWFLRSLRRLENLQRAPQLFGNLDLNGNILFDSIANQLYARVGYLHVTGDETAANCFAHIGQMSNGKTFAGIRFSTTAQDTLSSSTYNLLGDGTSTYINALTGGSLYFRVNNATIMTIVATGITVGAPTGGAQGAGTINVSSGVFLNGTSYTNPDYALEHYYTGEITKFANNPGAKSYLGLMPLDKVEGYLAETFRLPGVHGERMDIFERADVALEKIEQAWLYIVQLHKRVAELEAKLQ